MSDDSARRIGDAERDDAIALLQDHLSAGRLDAGEFDERLDGALKSRTDHDLAQLFADLPGRRPGTEVVPASAAAAEVTGRAQGAPENDERRRRIAYVAIAALWPAALIANFAFGWHLWWLMMIPVFLSPVLYGLVGSNARDARRQLRRERRANRRELSGDK